MSDRANIESILHTVYTARLRGDLDEIMRYLDPDVHFEIVGDPATSPIAILLRGSAAVRPQLAELIRLFRFHSYEILSLLVDGEKAAVRARVKVSSTITGTTIDTELADFVEFREGRISSYIQHADTAVAGRLTAT